MQELASFLPDGLTPTTSLILILASFFTSALTAAAGVGGGLLMLGLMTYIIPITALIAVHGVVQLGSNVGRSWVQRAHIDWRITGYFLIGTLFGSLAGALLFIQLPVSVLQTVLGVFILIMIAIRFPKLQKAGAGLVGAGGLVTSFLSMFAGATGPIVAAFLHNLFAEHKKMVATHGATMSVQHGVKIAVFAFTGFSFWEWLPLVGAIILSGFAGTKAGTGLMNTLPERTLKTGFRIIMVFIAIDLIRSGILNPVKN